MIIRLERLGEEPFAWRETLSFPTEELSQPDLLELGEVEVRGKIALTTGGFLLRAELSYEQTLGCMRCLGPVSALIESQIDLLVMLHGGAAEADHELEEDDLGVLFLDEPQIDTEPLVREQLQLNVPMRPLCRPDCAGLCPECGADLNQGPCDCPKEIDPRWSALAKLRRREDES